MAELRRRRAFRGVLPVVAAVLLLTGCTADASRSAASTPPPSSSTARSPTPAAAGSAAAASSSTEWLSFHGTSTLTGAVPEGASLDHAHRVWAADLGGVVHGQPVVADGRIVAATERNRVVALDPRTGRVMWSRSLGTPLTNVGSVVGCGNIDPLGITSTPAIDPATQTVFVVAELDAGHGVVRHVLTGLSLATGRTVRSADVDPPLPEGERAIHLLQRVSLAVANGRVYVGYGGNNGDCGRYHGWVVGVRETGAPDRVSFEVAPDGEGGAIWESGGGIAVDAAGNLFVTTGNANPDPPQGGPDPKRYTESVVKLSPDLRPLASFKDRIAGGDEDLSTGNPVLLPGGLLFAVGKTDVGFVLRQSDLSQVAAIPGVCGSDPDGAPAYDAGTDRVFVPCRGRGIQEVDLRSRSLGPRLSGANSGPTLIGRNLWALDYPSGAVTEWDPRTRAHLQTLQTGASIASFATPTSALGLLLVPTDTGVTAFGG
jgi:polyvinyl alcohol dehydrogenase (cytochrome)